MSQLERRDRPVYRFGSYRLDIDRRLFIDTSSDRAIALPGKALDLLVYFVEHRGELLGKRELIKALWPDVEVEDNSLDRAISTLRRHLGEAPGENRFLVTVPGRGYRFVAELLEERAPQNAPSAASRAIRSMAVLPLVNLTGQPDREYLADGMAEELICRLSRIQGLKVPARTSSFAYKGRQADARRIAHELSVDAVLEGSLRSAGDRIRITVQLIDGATGYHLWSQSLDRQSSDVFRLQDELATGIALAVRGNLDAGAQDALRSRPTADLEAYELYLQGQSLTLRAQESLRALKYFDRAIARDPHFARPRAGKAIATCICVSFGFVPPSALADADREAERALSLDPDLALAHAGRGLAAASRGRWIEAEQAFRQAESLDPLDAQIQLEHVIHVTQAVGYLHKARSAGYEAYRLAPAQPVQGMQVALGSIIAGYTEEAVRFADLSAELGFPKGQLPLVDVYAHAAIRDGRAMDAAELLVGSLSDSVRQLGAAEAIISVHSAMADPTRAAGALAALEKLAMNMSQIGMDAVLVRRMLHWYTMLGSIDRAYDFAFSAYTYFEKRGHSLNPIGPLWLPEMRPFRRDPRFQDFVTRLRLPEFWNRYGPPDGCELHDGNRLVVH